MGCPKNERGSYDTEEQKRKQSDRKGDVAEEQVEGHEYAKQDRENPDRREAWLPITSPIEQLGVPGCR